MTSVSVAVTTYRRARGLDRMLGSLARQTRQPDEVVVSDDSSPDDTGEVVRSWMGRIPGLRYSRNEHNLRMPGNLNRAVALCNGDLIANLHDDDTYDPRLLELWERALADHPTAGFVFCGTVDLGPDGLATGPVTTHAVTSLTPGREFFREHYLHKFSSIVWGTVMARRLLYEKLGQFDEAFGHISDVDMWMRMCMAADVAYVAEPLIHLNWSPTDERPGGSYNWRWFRWMSGIQDLNIRRFFEGDEAALEAALSRQRRCTALFGGRRLLGCVRRGDLVSLREGLKTLRLLLRAPREGEIPRG